MLGFDVGAFYAFAALYLLDFFYGRGCLGGGVARAGGTRIWCSSSGARPTWVSTDSGGPGACWGPVGAVRGGRPRRRRVLRGSAGDPPSAAYVPAVGTPSCVYGGSEFAAACTTSDETAITLASLFTKLGF